MTTEEKLRAHLLADATVAGLVAARIYPVIGPADMPRSGEAKPLPFIVMTRLGTTRLAALDASTGWSRARIQLSCWAEDASAARGLANAVRALVDSVSTASLPHLRLEQEAEVYDRDIDLVGRALDITIMIQE